MKFPNEKLTDNCSFQSSNWKPNMRRLGINEISGFDYLRKY